MYYITNVQLREAAQLGNQMLPVSHLRIPTEGRPMEKQFIDHGPFTMVFTEDVRFVKVTIQTTGLVHLIPIENIVQITVVEEK